METTFSIFARCCLISLFAFHARAFSLRGPDGSAVNLNEEYRWNVPVITYGFDQSFVDYFGPDGVKAVDAAFQTLNDLPRASKINLDDYPLDTRRYNAKSAAYGGLDLKSVTLGIVLEQMGLASPTKNIFVWNAPLVVGDVSNWEPYVLRRNFDPVTLLPSDSVNGVLYSYSSINGAYPVDPLEMPGNAVADQDFQYGQYYTGLTRDDVGGLRYLLNRTNINREPRLSISGPSTALMWRHGVEKITFVRSRLFHGITSRFTIPGTRVVILRRPSGNSTPPDFLFRVSDVIPGVGTPPLFDVRSRNWVNEASQNNNPGGAGPGVIGPIVSVSFSRLGLLVETGDGMETQYTGRNWASFDHSTNAPVFYPQNPAPGPLPVIMGVYIDSPTVAGGLEAIQRRDFQSAVPIGGEAELQVSSDRIDWNTLATVMNTGTSVEWRYHLSNPQWDPSNTTMGPTNVPFFRVIPKPAD